jgi:hypothetical protein
MSQNSVTKEGDTKQVVTTQGVANMGVTSQVDRKQGAKFRVSHYGVTHNR